MLLLVNNMPRHPMKGPRTKGPRAYIGTRVPRGTTDEVDAARARDAALLQGAPRPTRLREAITRNNWITAAILAARAANPDLAPLIEWGNRTADREPLAVRVVEFVAEDIDQRRARIPRHNGVAVTRPQWLAAAVRWALDQPPGAVADQLVNVPRRDYRGPGQQAMEVFAQQAV